MEEAGFDPKRRLCPDGACVGLIGPDGRCTVCARSGAGSADVQEVQDVKEEPAAHASNVASSGGFDPGRRLCDDGSCVGVVGADGLCGTCGRRAE
jgi:hypothetical protein